LPVGRLCGGGQAWLGCILPPVAGREVAKDRAGQFAPPVECDTMSGLLEGGTCQQPRSFSR
jgi:hypothetical protein